MKPKPVYESLVCGLSIPNIKNPIIWMVNIVLDICLTLVVFQPKKWNFDTLFQKANTQTFLKIFPTFHHRVVDWSLNFGLVREKVKKYGFLDVLEAFKATF